MSKTATLRTVPETADDTGADFAAGTEFGPVDFGEDISGAMMAADPTVTPGDPKSLVRRKLVEWQLELDQLTVAKAGAERRIAEANETMQAAITKAKADCSATCADAEADIANFAAVREAIDRGIGWLNQVV